jgi:hypothetical protein
VTAFELLINYLFVGLTELPDDEIQEILDKKNVIAKTDFLARRFGTKCRLHADLDLAIEVRHEIAHYFPRPGREPKNLPLWFARADKKGLLIRGENGADFDLSQKLASYKLAKWVATMIAGSVGELLSGSPHPAALRHKHEVHNFSTLLAGI